MPPSLLLQLLNGSALPSRWRGPDREILSAYITALRRRTAVVQPARRVQVRIERDGQSAVLIDGEAVAPVRFAPGKDRYGRFGITHAGLVAAFLKEHPQLPQWPDDRGVQAELSASAQRVVMRWRKEWEGFNTLRRCSQPTCQVEGGRLFLANRSQRDCDECRAVTRSYVTRWRHRQRKA